MKTLYNLIALVAIANMLILSGLVGYMVVSGRLDADAVDVIVGALRGEGPAEAPAATTGPGPATQPGATAAAMEPGDDVWTEGERRLALLDRQMRTVEDMRARLDDAMLKFLHDRELLQRDIKQFENQLASYNQASSDEGFKKSLVMYTEMPAKQAKTLFMKLDIEVVVRYLMNMSKRSAKKVLQEFKTPEEIKRCREVLERIRTQDLMLTSELQPKQS